MLLNPPAVPWYRILYVQTIIGVILGIVVGALFPEFGASLKPLGDAFIGLVKMMIGPIIFCTIVHGIASMGDLRSLGRLGGKALLYFEIVSTLALVIGLFVVNTWRPGDGFTPAGETFHAADSAGATDSALKSAQASIEKAEGMKFTDFVMHIIPTTLFSAFVSGDLLQVLLVSILIALSVASLGLRGQPALDFIDHASRIFFGVMSMVVKLAPIGAFGAMAFTVGSFGLGALLKLLGLMLGFYMTAALFVFIILGAIAAWCGFSIFRFLWYIREEIFLVLGTSSSETALPGMMRKMEALGCARSTVGLVIPTGYSFNLDGTNIYMAMAAIFLAQATNVELSWWEQLSLLAIAMLTSKGASGVTGAGFVTLAATLQVVPKIPIESLALLVGIDRFMSECRAITNLIGNGVATVVISRWEGEVTPAELHERFGQ